MIISQLSLCEECRDGSCSACKRWKRRKKRREKRKKNGIHWCSCSTCMGRHVVGQVPRTSSEVVAAEAAPPYLPRHPYRCNGHSGGCLCP